MISLENVTAMSGEQLLSGRAQNSESRDPGFKPYWVVVSLRKSHLLPKVLISIMKTCPYNVYPLEPHFYIAKLGYAGVYLFFLFLLRNIDCGYSLEPPRRGGSNVYPQSMF